MNSIRPIFAVPFAILAAASVPSAWDGPQAEILIPALEPGTTSLVYGSRTVGASILSTLDTDEYAFPGAAGDVVRIRMFSVTGVLDTRCMIVDATAAQVGTIITSNNGAAVEGNVTLAGVAPFKLILEDVGSNDTGPYDLFLEQVPPQTTERVLGYGRPTTDTLDHRLDLDAFRVVMIAGTPMQIRFNGTGSVLDPFYELYDPAGSMVDSAVSANGGTVTRLVTPTMTGTYTLLMSDRDRNDIGDYSVVVSCAGGICPPTASEFVRNGSGVNPMAYSVVCPAILGGTLSLELDATTRPAASYGVLYFYSAGHPGTMSTYGEILVDQLSPRLGKLVSPVILDTSDGVYRASFQVAVPADPSLAGFFTATQGALFGGGSGVQLTNAIDITVGF